MTFVPVHINIAFLSVHPFLGLWFELHLLLEVVVVVVVVVLNVSVEVLGRFVSASCFGILV